LRKRQRRGAAGGDARTASYGANAERRWGAPDAAGTAPRRRARTREDDGELQGRRGQLDAVGGGRTRRWRSGEVEPATWCTGIQKNSTRRFLTSRRTYRAAPKRPEGGESAADDAARVRRGGCSVEAVRVSGEGPQGCGGGFIGRRGAPRLAGLAKEVGPRRKRRRRGRSPCRTRLEEGDVRGPRVSDQQRARARGFGRAALGRKGVWAAALEMLGCGAGLEREGGGAAGGGKRRGTSRLAGWARKQNGPDRDRG
jgi:hypothetical protein